MNQCWWYDRQYWTLEQEQIHWLKRFELRHIYVLEIWILDGLITLSRLLTGRINCLPLLLWKTTGIYPTGGGRTGFRASNATQGPCTPEYQILIHVDLYINLHTYKGETQLMQCRCTVHKKAARCGPRHRYDLLVSVASTATTISNRLLRRYLC